MKLIDVSEELVLQPWGNGIKLLSPDTLIVPTNTSCTVKDIMAFPFNVAFSNTELCIKKINDKTAESMGFESPFNAQGTNVFSVLERKSAEKLFRNNFKSMRANKSTIEEEDIIRKDGLALNRVSFYFPWYSNNNKIIGMFGGTIVIGSQPIAHSLNLLKNAGLLNQTYSFTMNPSNKEADSVRFSKREKECLHYIIRGKTIKETANILGLSKRTVEYYFEPIKIKLGVQSKSEAIAKIFDFLGTGL